MIECLELEQMTPMLQEMLRPRVERLGYLGEYFKVAGHQPDALQVSVALTETLKSQLDQELVELVALTQSAWLGNDYERIQHERLCMKLGYTREWIADVLALQPQHAERMQPLERSVQALVLAILASWGREAQPELAAVVEVLGPAKTVAVLLLINKYAADSLFMNTVQLTAPAASIFAAAR